MRYKCDECSFETEDRQEFLEHREMHEIEDGDDYED